MVIYRVGRRRLVAAPAETHFLVLVRFKIGLVAALASFEGEKIIHGRHELVRTERPRLFQS